MRRTRPDSHACRTLAWGIAPEHEVNVAIEALYKANAQTEFAKVMDLTRRARNPDAHKSAKDKDESRDRGAQPSCCKAVGRHA